MIVVARSGIVHNDKLGGIGNTKFVIVYDTVSSNYNHIYGSVGYDITPNVFVSLGGDHYFYTTSDVAEPWHRPRYKVKFFSKFKLADKFNITADAYFMGGLKARAPVTGQVEELDPILDISVGLEYLISKQASIFVNTYNVIGKEYERYLNYPSRQLQVIGGLSYSF